MNLRADAGTGAEPARIQLAHDLIVRFGSLRFRAMGGSMWPAIAAGDVLEFHACPAATLQPGQVVLFRNGRGLVAHRLAAQTADGRLLTRGDALAGTDMPLDPADVLGVLVRQQRRGRHLPVGGRHWLRRQRVARWVVRRVGLVHRLLQRLPAIADLAA